MRFSFGIKPFILGFAEENRGSGAKSPMSIATRTSVGRFTKVDASDADPETVKGFIHKYIFFSLPFLFVRASFPPLLRLTRLDPCLNLPAFTLYLSLPISYVDRSDVVCCLARIPLSIQCTALCPLSLTNALFYKREENDKLRGEIRDHIRSYLCQTDQTMQLTKRLADTEKNLQRAHAEVFRLKLKIEEMVTGNENLAEGASPIYTVPPTRVVEDLKSFVLKKEDLTANVHPEKALKERVVLQAQLHQNVTIQSSSPPTVVTAAAEEIRTAENINPCMKVLSV